MQYCSGKKILLTLAVFTCGYNFVCPASAWALQAHGAPEGMYVHQIAHIYFFLALVYLYWDVQRSSFAGKGWEYLLKFCLCMLCWNVVAFLGHAMAGHVDVHIVSGAGGYLRGSVQGAGIFKTLLFYLAKFDHLFVVPALFYLYKGMRTLYFSVEDSEKEEVL